MIQASNRWIDPCWILFWGITSSIWCVTASSQLSATFDEPFYLRSGLETWRTGSYRSLMRAGTMPLPVDVETFPLFIWEQFRDKPLDPEADFARILPVARSMNLVFWWMLLFYGWRLARFIGGEWSGRLAVAFLACEPSLLAHAGLAVTDIAITATTIAMAYYFLAGRGCTWPRRVCLPAIWFGLSILAKASALMFGPMCLIVLELYRLYGPDRQSPYGSGGLSDRLRQIWRETKKFRKEFIQIALIGMAITFVYCGSDWRSQSSFVVWARQLPPGPAHDIATLVAENLRIFPNAGEGLVYQIKHNVRGHGAFLLGEWYPRAVWYYFPVALAVKLTLPVLIGFGFVLCMRPRSLVNPLSVLAIVLLLFSLTCRVQIGIRLVFPLLVFLLLSLAVALPAAVPRHARRVLVTMGLLALTAPALVAWPDGLRFTNQLWGGTRTGYKVLGEWNYDCGQGLTELNEWHKNHGEPPMSVWYYGADPRVKSAAVRMNNLQNLPLSSPADLEAHLRGTYIAVGINLLNSHPLLPPAGRFACETFRGLKPIARTRTFFIYDFTKSPTETSTTKEINVRKPIAPG